MDAIAKEFRRTLHPVSIAPPGMVFVPEDTFEVPGAGAVKAGAFWLDKYEVTNRQFKEFVDRGEYRKREHWKQPFIDRAIRAKKRGRFPGKKRWRGSSIPPDSQDLQPGNSVPSPRATATILSEASVGTRPLHTPNSPGKSLPTVHHWEAAADFASLFDHPHGKQFSRRGSRAGRQLPGVGRFGTYDMAGQCDGMVLELCRQPALGAGRSVAGSRLHVQGPRQPHHSSAVPLADFVARSTSSPLPEALMRPLDLRGSTTRQRQTGGRRCLSGIPEDVRV